MKRRGQREQLFKLLFRADFYDPDEMPQQTQMFFESGDLTVMEEDRRYIADRLTDILSKLPQIDDKLEESIEGWKLSRIGKVEKTLLRLAVYELDYDTDIPTNVAISEAVELSRKYGQENAASFVNGILARYVRGRDAGNA